MMAEEEPSLNKIAFIFSLVFLLLSYYYLTHPDYVYTYFHNSEVTYLKAQDMVDGKHVWGTFFDGPDGRTPRYEFHMPEGPTYIMAGWLYMGLPIKAYRILPILTSLMAHLFFLFALFHRYKKHISPEVITVLLALIAFQPTNIAWTRAVDEGSYDFSLLLCAFAVILRNMNIVWIAFIGFLIGCQEVYRNPMMALTLFLLITLVGSAPTYSARFSKAFKWTLLFTIMVTLGIILHIVHIGLVWGSIPDSFNEHVGTLLGRADIDNEMRADAQEIYESIAHSVIDKEDSGRLATIFRIFKYTFWEGRHQVFLPMIFIVTLVYVFRSSRFLNLSLNTLTTAWSKLDLASMLCLLALTPTIWTLLVPNHANVHYYYIARDWIGFFWGLLFIGLETQRRYKASSPSPEA